MSVPASSTDKHRFTLQDHIRRLNPSAEESADFLQKAKSDNGLAFKTPRLWLEMGTALVDEGEDDASEDNANSYFEID